MPFPRAGTKPAACSRKSQPFGRAMPAAGSPWHRSAKGATPSPPWVMPTTPHGTGFPSSRELEAKRAQDRECAGKEGQEPEDDGCDKKGGRRRHKPHTFKDAQPGRRRKKVFAVCLQRSIRAVEDRGAPVN